MRLLLLAAVAAWVVLAGSTTRAQADPLAGAIAAFEEFDYERSRTLLRQLSEGTALSAPQRARALVYLGIVEVILGDGEAGELSFAQALRLEPQIELPADTSPKIIDRFERVKRLVLPVPAAGDPQSSPPPVETPSAEAPPMALATPTPPETPPGSTRVFTWIGVGVTVLAAMGGALAGGMALQSRSDFEAEPWADRAVVIRDDAETRAVAANIMFGLTGALALATVLIAIFEGP